MTVKQHLNHSHFESMYSCKSTTAVKNWYKQMKKYLIFLLSPRPLQCVMHESSYVVFLVLRAEQFKDFQKNVNNNIAFSMWNFKYHLHAYIKYFNIFTTQTFMKNHLVEFFAFLMQETQVTISINLKYRKYITSLS